MATTNPVLGDTGAKQGQRLLDEHFDAGAGSPAHIIVPQENVDDAMATLSNASDSREAESTVAKIRDELHALPNSVLVGGITATDIDTNLTGERDLRVIIPLVLVVVWVILAILLHALLPPTIFIAATVISFGTALGTATPVFNHVLKFPGAEGANGKYSISSTGKPGLAATGSNATGAGIAALFALAGGAALVRRRKH